ncbi:helix-turn-helix domain-containing protein [Roseococcus suduntuyensis]|uniref:helix-turn-helix domain-containing protein n=1 Tax=Roseococcus suduntuyensis TaxID=455361 RepID=UPI0035D3DFCD
MTNEQASPAPNAGAADLLQLGVAVRQARLARAMSQEALADRAGIHVTYLSGVERGKRNPTFSILVRIAAGLAIAPSCLVLLAEKYKGPSDE